MRPALKIILVIISLFFWTNDANAKNMNPYAEIAAKYDVQPFNLEYGYPLRHKWDEREITGVIYLTDDVEFFEKLSPRVYIAQPNEEDAELIATYYADDREFPKYYLVVDNTVKMSDLIVFMDRLMKNELEMEICFVGGNGKYVSVKYDNWSRLTDPGVIVCGWNFSLVFEIMMNAKDDLLVNGRFTEMDSVHSLVAYGYNANLYSNDRDYDEVNYSTWNREKILQKEREIEFYIEKHPENKAREMELEKIKKMRRLTNRFETALEPSRGFHICLKKQRGTSLKAWYEILNEVQYGVHLARYSYFRKRFNGSYLELFYSHDPIYLELLEFTFPDRMTEMEEYWESEPPPPIEIIEAAPESPLQEPELEDEIPPPPQPLEEFNIDDQYFEINMIAPDETPESPLDSL